jgi:hypothetical protein
MMNSFRRVGDDFTADLIADEVVSMYFEIFSIHFSACISNTGDFF